MSTPLETTWRHRFDEAARRHDDDYAISLWSRAGHDMRLAFFFSVFNRITSGKQRILDLGCGPGGYAVPLASDGHTVHGLDYSIPALHKARQKKTAEELSLSLTGGETYHLPFSDGVFDCVVCIGVLEVISDGETALKEIVRVLKSGGRLFLITHNAWFLPNQWTDRVGQMNNFNPYALSRKMSLWGYTSTSIEPVVLPWKPIRFIDSLLNRLSVLAPVRPIRHLLSPSFLILAKKNSP